jgi:hypothetical protein
MLLLCVVGAAAPAVAQDTTKDVGMLDAALLRDVTFLSGGLPATYGNRASSVLQITQRDGSRTSVGGRASNLDIRYDGGRDRRAGRVRVNEQLRLFPIVGLDWQF